MIASFFNDKIIHLHFFVGILLLSFAIPFLFYQEGKISKEGAWLWGYGLFSAAFSGFFRYADFTYLLRFFMTTQEYDASDFGTKMTMGAVTSAMAQHMILNAARSFGLILAVPIVVLMVRFNLLLSGLKVVVTLNALSLIFNRYGIFNIGTQDAGFIAAFLPMFLLFHAGHIKENLAMAAICLFSVIHSGSATGMVTIFAMILGYAFYSKQLIRAFVAMSVVLPIAVLMQGKSLITSDGRIAGWSAYLSWWWDKMPIWTGTGISTFEGVSTYIPNLKFNEVFIWLHNDWLQILFDGGIIGLTLVLIFYIHSLNLAKKNLPVLLGLIGLGTCMLTYSPMHFIFGQIYAMALVRLADVDRGINTMFKKLEDNITEFKNLVTKPGVTNEKFQGK